MTPDHGAAWFLGKGKTVRACYEVAPGFGADSVVIETSILQAYQTWKNYIDSKEIFRDIAADLVTVDGNRLVPSVDVELIKKCDGSEDLKFYFGATSAEVETAKAEFDSPIAFAHRSSYDATQGWGKGFIWVANSIEVDGQSPSIWSLSDTLQGILLHEIGHVLGCDHVQGTIMDEYIADWVMAARKYPTRVHYVLTSIDNHKELYSCPDCSLEIEGRISPLTNMSSIIDDAAFEVLMGRKPQGEIHTKFRRLTSQPHLVVGNTLTLSDEKGSHEFYFEGIGQGIVVDSSQDLFKAVLSVSSDKVLVNKVGASPARILQGQMKTASGKWVSATITFNAGMNGASSPVSMTFVSDGQQSPAFYQSLPGSCYGGAHVTTEPCNTW